MIDQRFSSSIRSKIVSTNSTKTMANRNLACTEPRRFAPALRPVAACDLEEGVTSGLQMCVWSNRVVYFYRASLGCLRKPLRVIIHLMEKLPPRIHPEDQTRLLVLS